MTNARKIRIRLVAAALGAAALLVPVTIAPDTAAPLKVTEACAGNACCFELGSRCDRDGETVLDHYTAESCPDRNTQ